MLQRSMHAPSRRSGADLLARILAGLAAVLLLASTAVLTAQEAARAPAPTDLGKLFDAVVKRTAESFWDKERLAKVDWLTRAAEVRQSVVEAPSLEEGARRINALLGELKTSHTALLTPDEVDYYILLAVFGMAHLDERFWGAGITYPGIGHFSVRIDGRDFVDAVLEGSPAARAGLRAGDELLEVDGAPYHPIRSFRGKVDQRVVLTIRRTKDGAPVTLRIPVVSIAPLYAFGQATRASARIVERNGRRIGYVHVWASVGEESAQALSGALSILGLTSPDKVGAVFFPKGYMRAPQPERRGLDGLIIDMRGKIGGTGSNAGRYLDILDARGPAVRSRGAGPGWTRDLSLRGRTAVLIDRRTRSTAELFVHAYKRERQGALIGTRTAGAVSGAGAWTMPGGNLLYLAGVGLEVDGEILEGRGVAPDIEVVRPVPYAAGADPVLEAALDHLARLPPQPAPKPASKPGRGEW